jgi:hypothetical protein
MLAVFAITLFVSASLLFLVEPMVGKMMLPLLGGTPAVWNTCMVFFQVVLLAGYAYAHATTAWLGPRKQALFHLVVLVLPLLFFLVNGPLAINEGWIAGQEANPIPALLVVLTISVGVPMFVVCTSAPLLQTWFASTDHPAARDPYFLYGASNLGSMLALVGYPAVVEPNFTLGSQRVDWAFGFAGLAALTVLCIWLALRSRPAVEVAGVGEGVAVEEPVAVGVESGSQREAIKPAGRSISQDKLRNRKKALREGQEAPFGTASQRTPVADASDSADSGAGRPVTWLRRIRWNILAMVPSSLMLGVTTYITTDVAAIPLLWVLPLALYLLTFILVFAKISPRIQAIIVVASLNGALLAGGIWLVPLFISEEQHSLQVLVRALLIIPALCSLLIFRLQDDRRLIHRTVVLVLPLLILLLIFMMLADLKPGRGVVQLWLNIGIHCFTLFVTAMVCHGELALDRPSPKHLTEFFLWMSVGGVLGGLFNGLVAPLVFNSIVEYPLMMVVACLLVPPFGNPRTTPAMRLFDLILLAVFLLVAGLLGSVFLFAKDQKPIPVDTWPALGSMGVSVGIGVLGALVAGLVLLGTLSLLRDRRSPGSAWGVLLKRPWLLAGGFVLLGVLFAFSGLLLITNFVGADRAEEGHSNWKILIQPAVLSLVLGWLLQLGALGWSTWALIRQPSGGATGRSPWFVSMEGFLGLVLGGCSLVLLTLVGWYLGSAWPNQSESFHAAPWGWFSVALLSALLLGILTNVFSPPRFSSAPASEAEPAETWADRILDLALPASLVLLLFALFWGIQTVTVLSKLRGLIQAYYQFRTGSSDIEVPSEVIKTLRFILIYGVPAVLVYTFVDRWLRFGLGVGAILLGGTFCAVLADPPAYQERSFFGVLKVEEYPESIGETDYLVRRLLHGTTLHGTQFQGGELEDQALTYYHLSGPVGKVFEAYNDPKKPVAVIGLGTGTMATYAQKGQKMTFYDIDPVVKRLSFDEGGYFTYVSRAIERGADIQRYDPGYKPGPTEPEEDLVLGDARLTLKRKLDAPELDAQGHPVRGSDDKPVNRFKEEDRYGIMIVDAFSSDAIPIHLITSEALTLYRRAVRDDGIICFHISNRYLDLQPVLANLAVEKGMAGYHMSDDDENQRKYPGKSRSHWVILANKKEHLKKLLKGSPEDELISPTGWYPIDTVEEVEARTPRLEEATAEAKKAYEDASAEVKKAEADLERVVKESTEAETRARLELKPDKLKAVLTREEERRKTKFLDTEKVKAVATEKENRYDTLRSRRRETVKRQLLMPQNGYWSKVGIWSDDYSNLLSVFSW